MRHRGSGRLAQPLGITMSANTRLPIPLQLVGVTAVLVFAFSCVSSGPLLIDSARHWRLIAHLLPAWAGYYDPVFSSLGIDCLLIIASAVVFVVLLYARSALAQRVAIAYLALLSVALAWRIYIHFPGDGIHGFRLLSPLAKLYFALRIAYAIWLVWLINAVMPNYLLKRTAAGRLQVLSCAIAAAAA